MIPFHDSYVGRLNLRFLCWASTILIFSYLIKIMLMITISHFHDQPHHMHCTALLSVAWTHAIYDFTFSFLARAHDNDSYVAAQILIYCTCWAHYSWAWAYCFILPIKHKHQVLHQILDYSAYGLSVGCGYCILV